MRTRCASSAPERGGRGCWGRGEGAPGLDEGATSPGAPGPGAVSRGAPELDEGAVSPGAPESSPAPAPGSPEGSVLPQDTGVLKGSGSGSAPPVLAGPGAGSPGGSGSGTWGARAFGLGLCPGPGRSSGEDMASSCSPGRDESRVEPSPSPANEEATDIGRRVSRRGDVARGGAGCPNLLQRPGSRRSTEPFSPEVPRGGPGAARWCGRAGAGAGPWCRGGCCRARVREAGRQPPSRRRMRAAAGPGCAASGRPGRCCTFDRDRPAADRRNHAETPRCSTPLESSHVQRGPLCTWESVLWKPTF